MASPQIKVATMPLLVYRISTPAGPLATSTAASIAELYQSLSQSALASRTPVRQIGPEEHSGMPPNQETFEP